MDDPLCMAVLQRQYGLSNVLPCNVLIQGAELTQEAAIRGKITVMKELQGYRVLEFQVHDYSCKVTVAVTHTVIHA